tara:strand:+ start:1119 stop:1688 length:570 start_codon:yes stop_codon:yes gene_type:complete
MKNSPHQKAILIFGVIIPFVLILTLIGGTLYGRGKLTANHTEKVANFERYQTARTQANGLEATMGTGSKREKVEYWNSKINQDFIQSLTDNLNSILSKYDSSVLRQTAMGQASGSGSIGTSNENPSSRIQLSFEGGFKPMQLLMAELETEMPHILLESLAVTSSPARSESEGGTLTFQVVYLCWENPKE